VLLPHQQRKLARGAKDEEHAMPKTDHSAIAVVGIDIGKYGSGIDKELRRTIIDTECGGFLRDDDKPCLPFVRLPNAAA